MQIKTASIEDIPTIQQIAYDTWPTAYNDILSQEQLDYMLNLMYNHQTLKNQLEDPNFKFIFSTENNNVKGFASYALEDKNGNYKLHKLYVLPKNQSVGHGRLLIKHIINHLQKENAQRLRLNVNRNNIAVKFYLSLGFSIIKEEDIDIGNDYFMNDYVMERKIS